jgi:hypothetical protein
MWNIALDTLELLLLLLIVVSSSIQFLVHPN